MRLKEAIFFSVNANDALEYAAINLLAMIDDKDISVRNMKKNIENMVEAVLNREDSSLVEITKDKDTYYVFDSGYYLHDTKERIFGYTMKNLKADNPKYFGLYFSRESLLLNKLTNGIRVADIHFDTFDKLNMFLDELANTAVAEDWHFKDYSSCLSQPILKNYVEQTYYNAFSQGAIYRNDFEGKMCMNTGLLDPAFNDVYILCDIENYETPNALFKEYYSNPKVVLSSSRNFSRFVNEIPKPPVYRKSVSDLFFDCDIACAPGGIDINDKHIYEDKIARINNTIQDKGTQYNNADAIKLAFESAIRYSLALAKRNYKLVAPQLWPETGKIQFLMPIYLEGRCENQVGEKKESVLPNVALCLEDTGNGRYLGTSILTLDMAYQNARLIAKPDSFWLEPQRISARSQETKKKTIVAVNQEEFSVGQVVELENLVLAKTRRVRGNIVGSMKQASLSPTYLASKGLTFYDLQKGSYKMVIKRWDENADLYNVELAEE